jgi:hypothetical protein
MEAFKQVRANPGFAGTGEPRLCGYGRTPALRVRANPGFAGTIRAVNPRVVLPIAVLIVIAVIAFVAARPSPSTPVLTPEIQPPGAEVPIGSGLKVRVPERQISGVIETPTPLEHPFVAALIGTRVIATASANEGVYSLSLPATLEDAPLTGLKEVKLPNGEGRLRAKKILLGFDGMGANVRFVAFDDVNNNTQPDPEETSIDLAPFRAGQDNAMRGFFRYGLVLVPEAAGLKETQDHPTGAKNFYRYDLELSPGWHVIEGEFASQGFDIRESTGNRFDLIVPRTPSGNGPAGLVK